MRSAKPVILAAAATLASQAAWAQTTTFTQAGYTGLGITPNAHLLDWGRVEATYDRQLPGLMRDPTGHNFVVGFGLLPNLEIAGRLATNTLNCSAFVDKNCGTRDLSASGKVGIGLDAQNRFRVAAGLTDVGGAATNFRTFYGVLTYNEGPFEASAGLARRSGARPNVSMAPLHGPFAAAAWQPLPWVRGQIEYTDGNAWAGVRLFAPRDWLPEGWTAYVGSNHRLNDNKLTRGAWLTAGLSIPLYKVPALPGSGPRAPLPALSGAQRPLPAYEARVLPAPPAQPAREGAGPAPSATTAPIPARPVSDSDLEDLAAALEAKGLEDISIGRMPDASVAVRANNSAYNWNSVDALGAALGAIARTFGDRKTGYRLILTQRQIPLVAVTGQSDCLREWIADAGAACTAGQLSTPGTGALEPLHAGAAWVINQRKPRWQTLHVSISPVLRTNVGTEVGALDYSAGVNVGLQLPLWRGASVEWRRNVPLANSSDYEPNGVFGARRVRSETERVALVQTVRLPVERWLAPGDDLKALRWGLAAVTAQATIGRVGSNFDGMHGALRWEPGEGRHRASAEAGYFRNASFDGSISSAGPRRAKPLLASYRYSVTPTRTYLEATAGQFMYNDRGFQLGMRQWFSDVSVAAYYRRSNFQGGATRQFIGLELSLPIGPRRDVAPARHLQVGGTTRFSHAVETLVRDPNGNNAVRPGYGLPVPAPSPEATFNTDRAGLLYFEDNIRRIRDAAR
ncbi:YjbH domain-containing protein [Ramlibacter sp.]|uniref:YjbH domain-containing protein n=1 Tax=Ramlibacter sp. TaxID=1917967 RepID=UPI002CBC0669|nr:YjbH domain-containing protein [Ramlibacter sp.]HWI83889.1 YjbH domain-containing protein [Ramlibacter sp.]